MSETTHNLALPYIAAAQAQKHVTHNEALDRLDAIIHLSVADRDRTLPPGEPTEGARYLVAAGATGDWEGEDGHIAAFHNGWLFFTPRAGWRAWVEDEKKLVIFDGSSWIGALPDEVAWLGINTEPDGVNRLAVKSDAVLLSHDDVTPGDGSLRFKLNKNESGDTATVLFQTGFSGRAEMGTAGDDNLMFKVSPDGTTWHGALSLNKDNGDLLVGESGARRDIRARRFLAGSGDFQFLVTDINNTHPEAISSSYTFLFDNVRVNAFEARNNGDFAVTMYDKDTGGAPWRGNAIRVEGAGATSMNNALFIAANKDVGLDTNAPTTRLDVRGPIRCASYTVATVPSAAAVGAGAMIYVTDETGGATPAFSDGSDWRRASDRASISD